MNIKNYFNKIRESKEKVVWVSLFVVIALIISGKLLYGAYKKRQMDLYWQKNNTPTSYTGDGYKITFPCGNIGSEFQFAEKNFSMSSDGCSVFFGDNHSKIDVYRIDITKYLTNTLNPYDDIKCTDYTDEKTKIKYHPIYNEKRNINGVDIYICSWDSSILLARVIKGHTEYTLNVSPSDKNTTYQKLNNFLTTFELTGSRNY